LGKLPDPFPPVVPRPPPPPPRVRAKVEADVAAGKDAWESLQAVLLDAEATAIREPAPLETAAIREPEPEAVTRTR
jgi:hypothetical protein